MFWCSQREGQVRRLWRADGCVLWGVQQRPLRIGQRIASAGCEQRIPLNYTGGERWH